MQRPGGVTSADHHRAPRALLRTVAGRVLRRLRRAQGRTLADVAEAARISMPYLSELERGRKEASSEVLAAICAALGIDLAELLAAILQELAEPPVPVIQLRVPVSREQSRAPEASCLALAA